MGRTDTTPGTDIGIYPRGALELLSYQLWGVELAELYAGAARSAAFRIYNCLDRL